MNKEEKSYIFSLSNEKIIKHFESIFLEKNDEEGICHKVNLYNFDIDVERNDDKITVTISQMYEFIEFNTQKLLKLCNVFKTDKIEIDEDSYGGCPTCDYGSNYERIFMFS